MKPPLDCPECHHGKISKNGHYKCWNCGLEWEYENGKVKVLKQTKEKRDGKVSEKTSSD